MSPVEKNIDFLKSYLVTAVPWDYPLKKTTLAMYTPISWSAYPLYITIMFEFLILP